MKYKTELHCHTAEISPCSDEPGADVAAKYIKYGYTTVVVTNHFSDGIDTRIPGDTWEEKIDGFFAAADLVREAARGKLNVICGMELRLNGDPNDYLIYGAPKEAFYKVPYLFGLNIAAVHNYLNEQGAIVIQAHPFRYGMRVTPSADLDGYEIANGHFGHYSHNAFAEAWATQFKNKKMILTTGTDSHRPIHIPNAGILTDRPIATVEELTATLRGGNYELIRPVLDQESE